MKKQISLRWKILIYLLSFVFAMIFLIWLFQTAFLDTFYQSIKTKNLNDVAVQLTASLDKKEDIQEKIDTLSSDNEVCIRVVQFVNLDSIPSEVQYVSQDRSACAVARLSGEQVVDYWQRARENNGRYQVETIEVIPMGIRNQTVYKETGFHDIVLAKTVDHNALILVSTRISPVNSTVETLNVQLLFIAGIIVIVACGLAVFMNLKVTRPLEEINQAARVLATGNVDVQFKASGYQEINELNETLNYALQQLKEVDQMRRDLISNVSHDLRTPLTMIEGYSEMMRDLPGENTPENAQVILDEAHRLSLLVNDLLDLSRLESHQVTLNKEIVQMNELLRSIVDRYQKYMDSEGFELNLTCDDAAVYSDPQRLSQVLYNFINNAIQYSGNSRQIEIRCQKINESVRVEIQDFGEGIPSDQIPYIWDRYYKIDRTHVRAQKGSGIGLNICKEILELHQSKYGVISKLNEGTTFWFELPCVTKQL